MVYVRALIFVTFGTVAGLACAQQTTEIYKCQESSGRFTYTNDKRETAGKKCEVVASQLNVAPAQKAGAGPARAATGNSQNFPRESSSTRTSAKERQREILQGELTTEQGLLAKAREALAEQEAVRNGDERNYARVLERLQPFQENVELHQKNVEALQRELGNLNR